MSKWKVTNANLENKYMHQIAGPVTFKKEVPENVVYLVSAAPEMLEMLEGVQHICDSSHQHIVGLEELISKAKGHN